MDICILFNGTLCVCLSLSLNAVFLPALFPPLLCSSSDFPSLSFLSLPLSLLSLFSVSFLFHDSVPIPPASVHRYRSLLDRAEERRRRLLQRYNEFLLAYEAGDMLEWIQEKKAENTGVELDDVWELQKKFDEFQTVRTSKLLLQMAFGW